MIRVIIVEQHHGVTPVFQAAGFSVERHSHRDINTGLTNKIAHDIKQNMITLLWSEFPIVGYHVAPDKYFAHLAQLMSWANMCADVGILFILFGAFGSKWKDSQVEAMINTKRLMISHHRMCHFNLHVDATSTEPSSTCFVTASTKPLKPHPCKCNVSQQNM